MTQLVHLGCSFDLLIKLDTPVSACGRDVGENLSPYLKSVVRLDSPPVRFQHDFEYSTIACSKGPLHGLIAVIQRRVGHHPQIRMGKKSHK